MQGEGWRRGPMCFLVRRGTGTVPLGASRSVAKAAPLWYPLGVPGKLMSLLPLRSGQSVRAGAQHPGPREATVVTSPPSSEPLLPLSRPSAPSSPHPPL